MKRWLNLSHFYDSIRDVKITGKIVRGVGRGRSLGFPTLNIEVKSPDALNEVDFGVYAVWVYWQNQRYAGALHYGFRPTFNEGNPSVEIFLLDMGGVWYGREVEVELIQKIRDIQKFKSAEALKKQICKDIELIQNVVSVPVNISM